MSLSGPLILLAILVLSLLILVGLLPFGLRRLAHRNRAVRRQLAIETAALDHNLLDSAERLRPFHKMKAVHFQEQREAVRRPLLEAREERRGIDRRLARLRLVQPPAGGWPGEFFLRQPAHYVTIPLDSWHLWQAGRHAARIRTSLEAAAAEQETLHQLPQALRQAAADLRDQTLPTLVNALQTERVAGLGRLEPLEERLQQLQQKTTGLAANLRVSPAAQDDKADELALELEAITGTAAQLEEEIAALHQRRLALDSHRQQIRTNHNTFLQSLPPNHTPENLTPILQHIDALFQKADQQRGRQEFEKCEECLNAAGQFTELSWRLYQTGRELEQLVDVQQVSPLADQIRPVLNQWPPLIQQSHQLLQPNNDNVSAGTHALYELAGRIQTQAQHILAEHRQIIGQIEARADQALDTLAAAWDSLQAVLPLAQPDPLADKYHALWPKREAARGVPQLLEDFSTEAGQLTNQIDATRATLQDHQRQMQETLGRLPKILAEAQETAQDWLCLQRLAEQLAALRTSLENLYQTTFAANTREEVNKRISDFKLQTELVNQKWEELRFEAHEIGRLDGMIRDHWQAIQDNPAELSEAKINRAVKLTDSQYERALAAERCKDTRAALEKCLSYVEKLALN